MIISLIIYNNVCRQWQNPFVLDLSPILYGSFLVLFFLQLKENFGTQTNP
jgi:hypothetical protein